MKLKFSQLKAKLYKVIPNVEILALMINEITERGHDVEFIVNDKTDVIEGIKFKTVEGMKTAMKEDFVIIFDDGSIQVFTEEEFLEIIDIDN